MLCACEYAAEADKMITEIAQIEIKPGTEKDYEAAVAKAVALPPIEGFYGFELHRSIEKPLRLSLSQTLSCLAVDRESDDDRVQ